MGPILEGKPPIRDKAREGKTWVHLVQYHRASDTTRLHWSPVVAMVHQPLTANTLPRQNGDEPSHAREWRWPVGLEIKVNSRHPVMRVVRWENRVHLRCTHKVLTKHCQDFLNARLSWNPRNDLRNSRYVDAGNLRCLHALPVASFLA